MRNMDWLVYTYRHRRAFEYCVKKHVHDPALREAMLRRARVHDMDKMVMYLFMDQSAAQQLHIQTQPHHLENQLPRTYEDLVETALDYECAPYTKPDKPLNAYDFVKKLLGMGLIDRETGEQLIDILDMLGIAQSGTVEADVEGCRYCRSIELVTEEMLLAEILRYIDENRDNALSLALRQGVV